MKLPAFHCYLLACCLVCFSCSEPSLTGKWKLTRLKFVDARNNQTVFDVDLTDLQKARKELLSVPADHIDPTLGEHPNMEPLVDEMIEKMKTAGFELYKDGKFLMASNGAIFPTVEPGWHFGDSLDGRWKQVADTLTFDLGEDAYTYSVKFKILELNRSTLKLRELSPMTGNELNFSR
jgi:hypothetical protein